MTVAAWEMWSVAAMLISTHGSDAEAFAERKLADAEACGHSGDIIVWRGVRAKLEQVRAEQA